MWGICRSCGVAISGDGLCPNCHRKTYGTAAERNAQAFTNTMAAITVPIVLSAIDNKNKQDSVKKLLHFNYIQNNNNSGWSTLSVIDNRNTISLSVIFLTIISPIVGALCIFFLFGKQKPKSLDIPPILGFKKYSEEMRNGLKVLAFKREAEKGTITDEERRLIESNEEVVNMVKKIIKILLTIVLIGSLLLLCFFIPLAISEGDDYKMAILITNLIYTALAGLYIYNYRKKYDKYIGLLNKFKKE